jgi:hypothetical protein
MYWAAGPSTSCMQPLHAEVCKPDVCLTSISKDMLRDLLADVCSGFYRAGLLSELIPPSEWYLETLHLIINTGNCWFEVARNVFQYLLTNEGQVRDRVENPPDSWPQATSGSRQPQAWRDSGYDFEALITSVFGRKMSRPLTKYHGTQVETLFRQQDLLWEQEEFKVLLDRLHDDGEVGHIVTDLRHIFGALSVMHCELNKPNPDLQIMEQARAKFEACSKTFVCEGVLAPFAYKIKFYDHALMRHACMQTEKLQVLQLSLAKLSSKFLEANNKVVKAVMRRLPGGGVRRPEGGHLPLVQGFKRCYAASCIVRYTQTYPGFAEELSATEEEDMSM